MLRCLLAMLGVWAGGAGGPTFRMRWIDNRMICMMMGPHPPIHNKNNNRHPLMLWENKQTKTQSTPDFRSCVVNSASQTKLGNQPANNQ